MLMLYYETASGQIIDVYVTDYKGMPMPDELQDWTLLGNYYSEKDGFLAFQAERAFEPAMSGMYHKFNDDSDMCTSLTTELLLHGEILPSSPTIAINLSQPRYNYSHQQNKTSLTLATFAASSGNTSK